jgi:hypothetical protein
MTEKCDSPNCVQCGNPENWYVDSITIGDVWYEVSP